MCLNVHDVWMYCTATETIHSATCGAEDSPSKCKKSFSFCVMLGAWQKCSSVLTGRTLSPRRVKIHTTNQSSGMYDTVCGSKIAASALLCRVRLCSCNNSASHWHQTLPEYPVVSVFLQPLTCLHTLSHEVQCRCSLQSIQKQMCVDQTYLWGCMNTKIYVCCYYSYGD